MIQNCLVPSIMSTATVVFFSGLLHCYPFMELNHFEIGDISNEQQNETYFCQAAATVSYSKWIPQDLQGCEDLLTELPECLVLSCRELKN